jgi:hypothetical protein
MTPKEKAAELISKFRQILPFSHYTGIGYTNLYGFSRLV